MDIMYRADSAKGMDFSGSGASSRPKQTELSDPEFTTFLNVSFDFDDGFEQLIESAPHRRNKNERYIF